MSIKSLFLTTLLSLFMGKIYAISFKVDGINYAANGDTAIVKGYTEIPEDGILSIKSSVTYGGKDYVVTTIQNSAFLACVELRTLIIPSSIKYIYSSAFENCVNMIKLVLLEGNDKLYVLDKAFSNCNIQEAVIGRDLSNSIFSKSQSLKKVQLLDNIFNITKNAFFGCTNLSDINLGNIKIIESQAFSDCTNLSSVDLSSLETLGDYAFMNTGLESLKLDSDINYLGIGAFKDSSLKDVVINSPITKIPFSCFSGCIYLKHFDYPITVTEFGAYSFMDCPFSSFVLKECLSKIDVSAFAYCKNLSDIDWGNVTFIGNEAFKGCAVNKIVFPSCLATIGENAFQNCKNLETVDMSNTNVTNISSFSDCIQLTEFIFPKKLKTIDASCFNGCTSLVELILPNSLENIYSSAFGNMKSLQKIDLSNTSVTVIPSYCFKNCESLKNVTLNKNTSEIRDHAFYNCSNLTDIYNSYNIEIVYDDAFLETKVFDDAKDGPVMIGSALYYYKGQIEDNEYVVPSNVTCICKEAFSGQSFQSIKLNDKLLYIGKDAFKNCIELLALTIPNSVTTVESCSGCKKLAVLTLKESDTALELGEFKGNKIKKFSMGRNVYSSLDWLKELTTLIIGKKVTELSYKSIPDEKLTDLDLEDADEVLNLGYNKFVNKIKTLYLGRNIKVGTYQDKDKYSPFDDVTTIGNSFISLEDLTIGSKVNAICDYFCQDNTALTSLFIPENVKTIGKKAFYRNYNLNEIIFDEGVESIGESAFGYGEDEFNLNYEIINKAKTFSQITIPSSVKDIYPYAFSGIKVQHLDFSEGVKNLHNRCFMCIKTDSLYLPSSIILGKHCCFTNSKLKFVDASKVKGELNGAFSYNKLLENIILNNELKAIHSDFVFCCSLTKIKLPNKLREIGNGEFLCTPIEHLHIPSETEKVGAEILSSEWNCSYIPSVTLEGNEFSPMVKLDDSFCWSGETVESEKKLKSLFVYKDFEYTINHYTVNGTSETNLGMDSLVIGNIHKFTIKSSSDKRFYPQTAICLSSHLTSCDMWKPSNGKVFVLPGSNLPKDEVEYMYTVNKLNYEKTGDENIVFDGVNNMSFSIEPVFYQNEQEVPFVEVGDYDLSMKINGTSFDGIYPTCLKLSISDNSGIDEITNCTNTSDNAVYNLQGQKINKAYKGIVIQNGKKRIIK